MDDRFDILTLIASFGALADGREWDALQQVFAPQIRVDYRSLSGAEAESLSSAALLARWRAFLPGFSRTQHTIGLPVIRVNGDRATAAAPLLALHVIDQPVPPHGASWTVGGRYDFTLARSGGRWRVDGITLAAAWQDGNLELPRLALQRAPSS